MNFEEKHGINQLFFKFTDHQLTKKKKKFRTSLLHRNSDGAVNLKLVLFN